MPSVKREAKRSVHILKNGLAGIDFSSANIFRLGLGRSERKDQPHSWVC